MWGQQVAGARIADPSPVGSIPTASTPPIRCWRLPPSASGIPQPSLRRQEQKNGGARCGKSPGYPEVTRHGGEYGIFPLQRK